MRRVRATVHITAAALDVVRGDVTSARCAVTRAPVEAKRIESARPSTRAPSPLQIFYPKKGRPISPLFIAVVAFIARVPVIIPTPHAPVTLPAVTPIACYAVVDLPAAPPWRQRSPHCVWDAGPLDRKCAGSPLDMAWSP